MEFSKFSGVDSVVMALATCTNHIVKTVRTCADVVSAVSPFIGTQFSGIMYVNMYKEPALSPDGTYDFEGEFSDGWSGMPITFGTFNDWDYIKSRFRANVSVSVQLTADMLESMALPDGFFQRITRQVGPGPFARSEGRLSFAQIVFFDERLERYSRRDEWSFPTDGWFRMLDENSLPYYRGADLSAEPFYGNASARIHRQTVQHGTDAIDAIQSNLAVMRGEVHNMLVSRLGVSSLDARSVIPVFPLQGLLGAFVIDSCDLGWSFHMPHRSIRLHVTGGKVTYVDDAVTAETVGSDDPLLSVSYGLDLRQPFYMGRTGNGLKPATAISARTSPFVATGWNWKALRSSGSR